MGNTNQKNTPIQKPIEPPEEIKSPLPVLDGTSLILNEDSIRLLSDSLPKPEYRKNWTLIYQSDKMGKSFNRFCYHITGRGPNIVIIRDSDGHIFGGFAAETWKDKHPKFYGSPMSFVFQLHPSLKIYRATGHNQNFQYLNHDTETLFNGVGQGGQLDFFVWGISQNFEDGQCKGNPSSTFGSPILSAKENWTLDYMEVWEVFEPEDTYENEKILKKKGIGKSVLNDEDNADKVITSLSGRHNFSHFDASEEMRIKKDDEDKEKGEREFGEDE
eukprot:TRINITY_DN8623_c0_g1_i1.p1 TRINITY_DN8623_c0_g1~~TRINITY_DN8623_c0_g1_i1.p1  ORF type:complete len:273 (-),score=95.01 TRINITY_DN8623_c0_g1_i1:114-932(-)